MRPRLRRGSYFPDWLLARRRRAEAALVPVVATSYLLGVSTRRMEKLVEALGITRLSKSQVSEMAKDLDGQVEAFRTRPLDAGPYTFVAADALVLKVREAGRTVNVHALLATGVNAEGYREILGLHVTSAEDGAGWLGFFRDLTARGLAGVALVTSDARQAVIDELVPRHVASLVHIPTPPKRRRKGAAWSVDEASRFLASARDDDDPLYAAYVFTLVLGLRKGEVLGLPRATVDPGAGEIDVSGQLQRIRGQLIHKMRTKADDDQSGDVLPLPDICLAALELRRAQQQGEKETAAQAWKPVRLSPSGIMSDDLVFTTATGTNRDPRNFNRSFDSRCDKAGVRRIRVHDTRHTCASLLAALDVHPRVAMAILRHAQIAITMEVYTEVPDEVTRAALKQLGDRLSRPDRSDGS